MVAGDETGGRALPLTQSQAGYAVEQPGVIRILIADDHNVMRKGLIAMLDDEPGFRIVAEAGNGREAVAHFLELRPDVALLDLRMPVLDGIGAIREIRASVSDARIIVLTTFDLDEGIYEAVRAGARAYLLKDVTPEDLIACIQAIHLGETRLSPAQAARLAVRISGPELTARELSVLRLTSTGLSNKAIAAQLQITDVTVKTHLGRVFTKLGANSRTEAAAEAKRRGLI